MKKFLPYILILVVLVGVFSPTEFINSQSIFRLSVASLLESAVVSLANAVLVFLSWIAGFAGAILDYVLSFTIVNMNANVFGNGTPANPGITGINTAWKIIKDLMNIAFIFILLYESIKIIIGQGSVESVKRFVLGIVLASLLINFSLFFTKVLIDASNIVTIGVYRSILSTPVTPPQPGQPPRSNSIATILLNKLRLQTIYSTSNPNLSTNGVGGALIFLIGSSIIFLVSTFVMFAITANFIIRYITLIILLVLSPIAYMGIALSGVKKYQNDWWESLRGQLIFAPVFMIMLMIVIQLISSPGFVSQGTFADLFLNTNINPNANTANAGGVTAGTGAAGLVLNFAVVIGLLIATLTVSKGLAKKGSEHIGSATGWLTNKAGNTFMGGAAALGRNTMGNGWLAKKANDAQLLEDAQKKTGFSGAWARTKLYTARAAKDGTYDMRNATIPTAVIGDAVRGTLGRAKIGNFELGKAIGADDFRTSSIEVGAPISRIAGTGVGGKSYGETQAEKSKRLRDEQSKDREELKLAKANEDIVNGANADGTDPTDPAYLDAIDKMEKALATLSAKEVETLVDNNRELLTKQEFANRISVKQLEALEKSDKFSDGEKDNLKTNRFMVINDVNSTDPNKVKAAVGRIKGLSDTEIEMLSSAQLSNTDIVKQFRPAQFESIAKSSKFTGSQKKAIKEMRLNPLFDALDPRRSGHVAGSATYPSIIKGMITKSLTPKDVAGLMGTKYQFTKPDGTTDEQSILLHPQVVSQYTPNLLKRMGQEMSTEDIQEIRNAIDLIPTVSGSPVDRLKTWINSNDGQNSFS